MTTILMFLVHIITTFIGSVGYLGIVLLMVAESANIPIPSEAIMPFAGFLVADGKLNLLLVVLAGTAGNWIGSSISYWIGATGGRALVDKYGKYVRLNHHHLDLSEKWFRKYGDVSVFVGRLLPIVRTFISLPAGIARMNYAKFSLYTILGALPFCYLLAYAGFRLGSNWEVIRGYFHYLDGLVVAAIVLAIIYWVAKKRRK